MISSKSKEQTDLILVDGIGYVTAIDGSIKSVNVLGYFDFHHRRFIIHREIGGGNICTSEASTGLLVYNKCTSVSEAYTKALTLLTLHKTELATRIQNYLVDKKTSLLMANSTLSIWNIGL